MLNLYENGVFLLEESFVNESVANTLIVKSRKKVNFVTKKIILPNIVLYLVFFLRIQSVKVGSF